MKFHVPTRIVYSSGEFNNLSYHIEELVRDHIIRKPSKIALIIDKGVTQHTRNIKLPYKIIGFTYRFGEPTYQLLERFRDHFQGVDLFIAVGGGSTIDFTKGLAFLSTNFKPAITYKGFPEKANKPKPLIAIPTTAGTGSEVTYNAVFKDGYRKLGINYIHNYPVMAVLDPVFLKTCMKPILIHSAFDVLVHATECYASNYNDPLAQTYSREAFNKIYHNIKKVVDGDRSDSRLLDLQIGAMLGGYCLNLSKGGPVGALSYILGGLFNVPHGLAGAVFLPHIIKYNEEHGFNYWNDSLGGKIMELCELLLIPKTLIKFGVNKHTINDFLRELPNYQAAFDVNPVCFTVKDAEKIVKEMVYNNRRLK